MSSSFKRSNLPPTITSSTTEEQGGATSFSSLHRDIIECHILPKLDGTTLASASSSSTSFHHLCSQDYLWFKACNDTWPSTSSPRVKHLISKFINGGPRAFFAQSYPLYYSELTSSNLNHSSLPLELISTVDIKHKKTLIFSKVQETETGTGWFRFSPFRIDLLEPKDVITTHICHPEQDDTCHSLMDDMSLSWIIIDPIQRSAINLSSHKPVSVNRHWLTGEVQLTFVTIHKGPTSGHVQFRVVVMCGGSERGEMQIREVSLEVEDMEGVHMYGKDSLVILQRALEGKRGRGNLREEEGRRKYKEFLEMKERRKEKQLKREEVMDVLGVGFGISIFVVFWWFMLCT
ncbi:hypothetical protein LIER_12077 [Lithospermum erythrorhizon]|uniref:F-box protein n=1 Tax=Lithospermum erythrorhizon TaxID=34254 RepID=A0AAV3PUF7_LITER